MPSVLGAIEWPFGIAAGTAVGAGVSGGITPLVQDLINTANATHAVKPPAYLILARGVAEGHIAEGWATNRANEQGISDDAFGRLITVFHSGPGVALAFELWRRNLIDDGKFGVALKREGLEDDWFAPLRGLKEHLLSPAEVANAYVQGYMSETDASDEALLSGVSRERSSIQRDVAGLPPGPMDGLQLLRRGLLTTEQYRQLVREGHTKIKYIDPLLGLRDRILTAVDAANLWLKGWIEEPEAKRIGALNGYDGPTMDLLYKNRGRPATVRQAHIGFARGGRLPGAGDNEEATIRRSVEESNIRTEWFDLLFAQRYTYPSAFVLRALAQAGTFDHGQTRQILLESGWKPELAELAAADWTKVATAGASHKWADRARGRLFTAAHDDFMDGNASESDARAMLAQVGATGGEQDTIIALWNVERNRTRRDLTQAQILKLYKKTIWTLDQATAALEDQGMDPADADALLRAV